MTFSRILIAVDKTSAAFKSAEVGFSLAESLNATVAIIHIIDPSLAIANPDAGILPGQALAKLKQESEDFLTQLIELYGKNLTPFRFSLEGKVAEEIVKAAKNYHADILVVGSHNRQGFRGLFMEDIVKEIIPHLPCPILLTHEGED